MTKSFLEKKKIHQYRLEQQRKEEEEMEEKEKDKEKKREGEGEGEKMKREGRVGNAEKDSSSALSVLPDPINPTILNDHPLTRPNPLTESDGVSTKYPERANDPEEEAPSGGGGGISRSKFLNAIELSAEGISVLKKLHGQVW